MIYIYILLILLLHLSNRVDKHESNFFTFLKRRYCSFNICITIVLNSPPSLHLSCTLYWIELFGWQLKSANYSLITNRSLQWSRLLDKRVGMRTHRKLDYRSKRKLEVLKVSKNIHFWNFETSTRIFFIHFFPFIYMFVYEMVLRYFCTWIIHCGCGIKTPRTRWTLRSFSHALRRSLGEALFLSFSLYFSRHLFPSGERKKGDWNFAPPVILILRLSIFLSPSHHYDTDFKYGLIPARYSFHAVYTVALSIYRFYYHNCYSRIVMFVVI